MFTTHYLTEANEQFRSLSGWLLEERIIARQAPEGMFLITDPANKSVARCSMWWTSPPLLEGRRVGYIGHFAALDASAATVMLESASEHLQSQGCTQAIGPIDGNTWQRYRLITERGSEPAFFLEPDNPDGWPVMFNAAGFTPLANYYSAVNEDLPAADPRIPAIEQRLHELGITIRALDVSQFEEELSKVHALSLLTFRNNFLYSPISAVDFLEQYSAIRTFIRPELALLAEKEGQLIGFMFAIADFLRGKRGEPMDTVILKTLAVHPDHGGLGLGSVLMARAHEAARQLGFKRAIHALFHESNRSGRISGHTARVFRRYTLFAKPLGA